MADTIFALSSGAPPAGIGVIRISGPTAHAALEMLAGRLPPVRQARLARLRSGAGELLDEALILRFAGPASATGEDLAELHCHGGRAVVAAVLAELGTIPGLRAAEPGEFTRRAFANGRIDLVEAEGLADLLNAETELQRRAALASAGGVFSAQIEQWREAVLRLSAVVEAVLDFGDEGDVGELPADFADRCRDLSAELDAWLARPRAERLRDGYRVVLAGPPNAGKSSLFNALVDSAAAITSPVAGTTRDLIERPVALGGVPFVFVDTAGLNETSEDAIERIGVGLARNALTAADLVLWLGAPADRPDGAWQVQSHADLAPPMLGARHRVSAVTSEGVDDLKRALVGHALAALPRPGEAALNARQHAVLADCEQAIRLAGAEHDPLLAAEQLRLARRALDALTGRASTEDMLDALFGRFCIGK